MTEPTAAPPSEYRIRIRELPAEQRPRERLRDYGSGALSNAELLAIILRVGIVAENAVHMAERLLVRFGGLAGMYRATFGELRNERGLGEAKAAQLLAALELGRRLTAVQPDDRVTITTAEHVVRLLQAEMGLLEQEHLRVVLLNVRQQVLGIPEIYKGTVSGANVRAAEVLRPAVRENCTSIIVVHNHPSGDPTPSPQDVALTARLVQLGEELDINVLDHIILGRNRFVSLKELHLGFPAKPGGS